MRRSLKEIAFWFLNTAPPIVEMRRHPEFQGWADSLHALGQLERLAPLRETLNAIIDTELASSDPINQFLESQSQHISFYTYLEASITAERTVTQNPCAALILSIISLLGWVQTMGDSLYFQRMHYPELPYDVDGVYYDNPRLIPAERMSLVGGWDHIPYACALTGLKVEAFEGARQLVEHCYDMFMDISGSWNRVSMYPLVARYKNLAKQIQDQYTWAIVDLAEAFYEEGCHPDRPNFRAEIGAILWSMGLVPESQIFKSEAQPAIIPSRRFFQRLIRQSLDSIPYDSLLQYIWLEMKDRPPFSIREHKPLFSIINRVYDQFPFDSGLFRYMSPLSPSRVYAQTLISWFRGTFNEEVADRYFTTIQMMKQMPVFDDRHLVKSRMACLGHMLAKEFDWLSSTVDEQDDTALWGRLNDTVAAVRKNTDLYPEIPEPQNRMNVPLFHLVESVFSRFADASLIERGEFESVLDTIEKNRTSKLSYWLQIAPPLPSPDEQAKIGELLAKEEQLLIYLRGAYFLTHYNSLPRYFDRYQPEADDYLKFKSDPEKFSLSPNNGRRHYKELVSELAALCGQMQEVAPDYARKRLQPQIALDDLLNALNNHATPPEKVS